VAVTDSRAQVDASIQTILKRGAKKERKEERKKEPSNRRASASPRRGGGGGGGEFATPIDQQKKRKKRESCSCSSSSSSSSWGGRTLVFEPFSSSFASLFPTVAPSSSSAPRRQSIDRCIAGRGSGCGGVHSRRHT